MPMLQLSGKAAASWPDHYGAIGAIGSSAANSGKQPCASPRWASSSSRGGPGRAPLETRGESCRPPYGVGSLLRTLAARLRERFAIAHATIQIEPPGFEEGDLHP